MLIQLAVDRMTMEDALLIAVETGDQIDILEMGTSYIKDYGMCSIFKVKSCFPDLTVLADVKTCDEGEYEFRKAFEAGADIATVMGSAAFQTIEVCCETAEKFNRRVMIDLLECTEERIGRLTEFANAIFCIHLSKDAGLTFDHGILPEILKKTSLKTAAAGGISLAQLPILVKDNISIAIVGSEITGAADIGHAVSEFARVVRQLDPPVAPNI